MLMKSLQCIWGFSIFAVAGFQLATANENNADFDGEMYLQEIVDTYSSFSSYQDRGIIEVVYYENGKKVDIKSKDFATNYTKDGLFEIQWKKAMRIGDGIKYRIWNSKGETYSKYGTGAEFRSDTLSEALSRAAGISTLLTTYVPCLLYEEAGCFLCDSRAGYKVSSTVQEKDDLLRLNLVDDSGNSEIIWIDNKTKTLKKIEWWNERGNLKIHHKITYSSAQGKI